MSVNTANKEILVIGCFRLSPFSSSAFYKDSAGSEQPGFLLFRCKRKHFLKFSGKIEKIKMHHSRDSNHGSPAFRASVLTVRLPWHDAELAKLNGKINTFKQSLKKMNVDILRQQNIIQDHLGRDGLHLNFNGNKQLALNIIEKLRSSKH